MRTYLPRLQRNIYAPSTAETPLWRDSRPNWEEPLGKLLSRMSSVYRRRVSTKPLNAGVRADTCLRQRSRRFSLLVEEFLNERVFCRKAAGLSQDELAVLLGLEGGAAVRRYGHAKRLPAFRVLMSQIAPLRQHQTSPAARRCHVMAVSPDGQQFLLLASATETADGVPRPTISLDSLLREGE